MSQLRLQDLDVADVGASVGAVAGESSVVTFRSVSSSRILHGHDIALPRERARGAVRLHIGRLVVWRSNQDDGQFVAGIDGTVEIGGQFDSVAHRNFEVFFHSDPVYRFGPRITRSGFGPRE